MSTYETAECAIFHFQRQVHAWIRKECLDRRKFLPYNGPNEGLKKRFWTKNTVFAGIFPSAIGGYPPPFPLMSSIF